MWKSSKECGRKSHFYADHKTLSIEQTLKETERRRQIQLEYNKANKITPKPIIKAIFANPIPQGGKKEVQDTLNNLYLHKN